MALYVSAGRRMRRLVIAGTVALVVGLAVGLVVGRSTSPSIDDRVASVRSDVRRTVAGLRVVVLHDEAGAAATGTAGDSGTALVLARTRSELVHELNDAVWLPRSAGDRLLGELDTLAARSDRTNASFGQAVEALAKSIESTLGI